MKAKILTLIAVIFATFTFAQSTYTLDKNHARLSFSVTHLGISHVDGIFKKFEASLVSSKEDFSDAKIEMIADVNSISTEVDMRDADLKKGWFEADKYPSISFKSMAFEKKSDNKYVLKGNITMHGVTKFIEFDVTYNGKAFHPYYKKYYIGFTVSGTLKRTDFGVGGEALTTGVGSDIELKSNAEFLVN